MIRAWATDGWHGCGFCAALVELDAPLVGIQTRTNGAWEELGEETAALPSVWVRGEDIDFEAILGLEPDLIVGAQEDNEDIYDQLTAIAPTVLLGSEPTWLEVIEFAGDLTNRTEQAAALLASVDDRVSELEEAIAERWPDGVDVTLLRVRDDIRSTQVADRDNRSATWLLNAVDGITVTGDARNVDSDRLSPEQLREADGDVILLFGGGGGSDATQDQEFLLNVLDNPLWDGLSAVQAGRAFTVDSDVWFDGSGMTAFKLAVEDLLEYVAQAP